MIIGEETAYADIRILKRREKVKQKNRHFIVSTLELQIDFQIFQNKKKVKYLLNRRLPYTCILVACGHGIALGAQEREAQRQVLNLFGSCLSAGCIGVLMRCLSVVKCENRMYQQ